MMFRVSLGIAGGTSMVKTPVELVNSACEGIIPIDEIRLDSRPDGLFTTIADVLDPVCTGPPAWEFVVPGSGAIAGP